mmetsp:Transcript_24527/g.61361  ORF Transcript_24527/g.61361 Transcript_24527/m.61361 type:complete len:171 (+) Transcript_24527:73-585(+)
MAGPIRVFACVAAVASVSTSALTCYKYGPKYHKSEGGMVSIDPSSTVACIGSETSFEACIETCSTSSTSCYNYYQESGYGADGSTDVAVNYGKQQGGCFTGPVDSKWSGTGCNSTQSDDGEIRQTCCDTDLCNSDSVASGCPQIFGRFVRIVLTTVLCSAAASALWRSAD